MKKFLFATGLLLLIGAGCASSSETAAEQAKRDALKARTNEMATEPQAPAAAAQPTTTGPTDGTYCWDKAPKICHKISFSAGTIELVVSGKEADDEFKLTKQPSGKYSFTEATINLITFLTVKDAATLEAITLTGGSAGSTQSAPQTWKLKQTN